MSVESGNPGCSVCAPPGPSDDRYWFTRYAKSLIFLILVLVMAGAYLGLHDSDLGLSRPPIFRASLSAWTTESCRSTR